MTTQIKSLAGAPSTSAAFDKIYNSAFAHWVWGDTRIPNELKELIASREPQSSLELGCGLGRFSSYVAMQGIAATGIDFSPVAIKHAKEKTASSIMKPYFAVGDVTNLDMLNGPFDTSFDIGCFHCLEEEAQRKYAAEVYRLLKPGGTHLIWAIDNSPAGMPLSPEYIASTFQPYFQLTHEKFSRRRIIASHWYWLKRNDQ